MAKKMHFTQIGKGRLAQEVQDAFIEAQRHVDLKGVSAAVTLKINIYPPDPKNPQFGEVDYHTNVIKPASKSRKYTTLIEDGHISTDGGDPTDALQISSLTEEFTPNR